MLMYLWFGYEYIIYFRGDGIILFIFKRFKKNLVNYFRIYVWILLREINFDLKLKLSKEK